MSPKLCFRRCIPLLTVFATLGCDENQSPPKALGVAEATQGSLDGVLAWTVPQTPNGLIPNQSWFSIAPNPKGDIYLAACDHKTNSALFRLDAGSSLLRYLGDARAASEAAGNWLPGETAEKIHVRPLWYENRVYVATADYSNFDAYYLKRRGFHWYAYDEGTLEFMDLSKTEPLGVGAEHSSIFASALDEARGLIYAIDSPRSHLYQYTIATGTTVDLGQHERLTRPFYGPNRFLWVDSRGRVYFSVADASIVGPEEVPAPKYILSWDPVSGWGQEPSWTFVEGPRTGQWSRDKKKCFMTNGPLDLFLFDDEARTFQHLQRGILSADHHSRRTGFTRVRSMHLSPSGRKIYFANDTAPTVSLYEWDWQTTHPPQEIAPLSTLYQKLTTAYSGTTGHDAWDSTGKFYLTSFGGEDLGPTPDVVLLGIDPVRLKARLGILPGVPVMSLQTEPSLSLLRAGDLSAPLEVLVESTDGKNRTRVTMPAGITEVPLPDHAPEVTWQVVPDGDTYVRGLLF